MSKKPPKTFHINDRFKKISNVTRKLAATYNLRCTYCYWFRDDSVYSKPKKITEQVISVFLRRLETHLKNYSLKEFSISFHGGEPLLYGKVPYLSLCERLRKLCESAHCDLNLTMTTNGTLILSAAKLLL